METNNNGIVCYENEVPPFVESAVEQLYGNIFSSLREFRVYGWKGGETSTYVARTGNETRAMFLFERRKGRVRVLNESIRIDKEELDRFSRYIFSRYADVSVISFKAIETDVRALPFPHQRFNHLEDFTLALPSTVDAYLASLGKNTRRNIKRYGERLRKTFPSCRFEIYEKDAVPEQHIRALIDFNRSRMANKNIASVIDEEETRRIVELTHACGHVGLLTIEGEVVAGAISYRAGTNYFLNILAHDPRFDDYWAGFLCCYETVASCIARGGTEFHFLWGRYDYKIALGAVQRDLDNVTVYRSRLQLLLNGRLAWHEAAEGYRRQAKVWLKYEETDMAKMIRRMVERARDLRRNVSTLLPHGRSPA
ncbi:MAG TPA: GNAT family N-acetyltransferase [Noviherbaspirillum sp.]|uniref:GNAT family N-acetyltransferase n=1 Tax=Noviherbaspirillum sp. TaxID=1926288 RepID=UPI002F927DE4